MKFEVGDWVKFEGKTYIIGAVDFIEYSRGEEVYSYIGTNAFD
jgi:predicted secreted acid phosphatase